MKSRQIESSELQLKIGTMGSTLDSRHLENASHQNSDSVRLLADFRYN